MTQIEMTEDMTQIDAEVLAKAFRIGTDDLKQNMRDGAITSRFERGEGEDAGKVRLTFFSATRRVRITADESGTILTCSAADFVRPGVNVSKTSDPQLNPRSTRPNRGDALLDLALEGSFPASDPIAVSFDPPKQAGTN